MREHDVWTEASDLARNGSYGFVFGSRFEQKFDTERYFTFYRYLKEAFDRFQEAFDPDTMPDPALESGHGGWTKAARHILVERDDLRLVARITISQIKRLRDAGVRTCAELIASGAVPRINGDVLDRLRRQARLQVASRGKRLPEFEVLLPDEGKRAGLADLPPASDGDVYFDLEGFPLAENGLEYLFGAVTVHDGTPKFRDWWAHDAAQEKAAFESVVDWLHGRWKADPAMHIYDYAPYEVTALRRTLTLLDILRSLEVDEGKLLLVYNQTVASDQLTRERVEGFLGHRIPLEIAHDLELFHRATTTGRPVVQLDPLHPASRDLTRLAELVATPY